MKLVKSFCAIFALLVLTGAGCATMPASTGVVEEKTIIPVAAGERARSLSFQRLVITIPPGTPVGDWNCGNGGQPVIIQTSYQDLDPRFWAAVFKGELARSGYSIVDSTSSMFGETGGPQVELLVGANVIGAKANGCLPESTVTALIAPQLTPYMKVTMDTLLTIEWHVYDPIDRKTLYTTTTQGHATAAAPRQNIIMDGLRLAFAQATRNLAADPGFHNVVTRKADMTMPSYTGASPDQQTVTTAQTSAANGSSPASIDPPRTAIPRLPLSTQPFAAQAESLQRQVVTVFTALGHGSGFFIADGLVLTNHHVVGEGKRVRLSFVGGRNVYGEVIATDARRDVALISTPSLGLSGLPLRLDPPGLGSQVYVIGTPLDPKLAATISSGIVSSIRDMNRERFIQSDANIRPGNSGGPMLDDHGNVVGISDLARLDNNGIQAGINFFIPIGEALVSVGVTQTNAANKS